MGNVEISVKVTILKNMDRKDLPCDNKNYDDEYKSVLIQKMIAEAGCVVPWVGKDQDMKVCHDEGKAMIAENIYKLFKKKSLIDNEAVLGEDSEQIIIIKQIVINLL